MNYPTLKNSKNKINKAGNRLVEFLNGNGSIKDREVMLALSVLRNFRTCHTYPVNTFQSTLRSKLQKIDPNSIVAQRIKRLPSTVSKLLRFKGMQLARMQDIGGLRAVVGTIDQVHKLSKSYLTSKRLKHELCNHKDYIEKPKPSGYRGIHLVYKYVNPIRSDYDGLYVELQIRTRLQHIWATAVETMGTYLDQSLKSSEGSREWLDFFSLVSSAFAHIEKTSPVPGYEQMGPNNTYQEVIRQEKLLDISNKLMAFNIVTKHITTDKKSGVYHLIALYLKEKKVSVNSYSKENILQANKDYTSLEGKSTNDNPIQVVLVSTGSIKDLRKAYPSYFLDTREFLSQLNKLQSRIR
jgi:ppGpp synthetase/RelA/SpoT-type nucleotidyltranferase